MLHRVTTLTSIPSSPGSTGPAYYHYQHRNRNTRTVYPSTVTSRNYSMRHRTFRPGRKTSSNNGAPRLRSCLKHPPKTRSRWPHRTTALLPNPNLIFFKKIHTQTALPGRF
ncbi:MAG: hypothetical protein [Microviridae sp.]|nr:MAG: hypothetical protein [Microviridae sp.]